jgi:NAD(P)-dependent dehydrogenase (short-subunit alcohol dehydrogenase family)
MAEKTFDLTGKVAVVTGGGRGIGRAIALALAEAGADVVATSRSQAQIEQVAKEIEALGRRTFVQPCDVSKLEDIQALLARVLRELGKLDIVVNAAAISPIWKRIEEVTDEEWDQIMAVNLRGAFLLSREAGKVLLEQGSGSLIHIASIAGLQGTSHIGPYSVSKAGLIGLVRVLAYEWAGRGVRVNAIAPGWVRTAMTQPVLEHPEISKDILGSIPLGRAAEPEEIAPLALYLASDASKYATGQIYIVDGGQTL